MESSDKISLVYKYAPYPILALVSLFVFWVRMIPYENVVRSDAVYYSGNDPWYHMRMVHLIVNHFPSTPQFDPWSQFPYGTGRHSGFGGLFDQIIALASILVGMGDPSPRLVNIVGAVAPAVFGAGTVIVVYFIVSKITDRWTGIFTAFFLSLFTGQFLNRTMVGTPDHQSAEAFFGAIAVLGMIYAVVVAYREKPTVAHIKDKDWSGLRKTLIVSSVSGVGIASYLMMWPPGIMLIFTFGVFVVLQMVRDHIDGEPTEYLALVVVATFSVTSVVTLLYAKSYSLSSTDFSLLQPLISVGVGFGAITLHYISSYMRDEGYNEYYYPGAIAGLLASSLVAMAVVYPRGIHMLQSLITRIYSFGLLASPGTLTVAEISPASIGTALSSFGLLFIVALISMGLIVARVITENRPLELLVLLWSFTMFSAYFTMIRFGYYVAVNIAVLSGFFVWWVVVEFLEMGTNIKKLDDVEPYQVITILVLLVLVIPGNVVAIGFGGPPAWQQAPRLAGSNQQWANGLDWVGNNTPQEPLEYNKLYQPPDDMDFDYPVNESPLKGAYGIMSWWDYGHWITVQGHRIPVANPFQQNEFVASDYLTSLTEGRSNLILDALPSMNESQRGRIDNLSEAKLKNIASGQSFQEENEDVRYVMIDDQMAAGKFGAIATWTNFGGFNGRKQFRVRNRTITLPALGSKYYNTTLARLYYDDANGMEHYRLVHETRRYSLIGSIADLSQGRGSIARYNRVLLRRNANRNLSRGVPMKQVSRLPSQQTIPAGRNRVIYDFRSVASVKTFERVEGAHLVGSVNTTNSTEVTAILGLRTTNTNRSFTYQQKVTTDSSGNFNITVPYPTSDNVTVSEGGTDPAVVANGNYTVYTGTGRLPEEIGSAQVSERDIYFGNEVRVELQEFNLPTRNTSATGGTSPGSASGG